MDAAHVAVIGFGTIGTGVARILLEHAERISARTGRDVRLAHVCDKDTTRDRGLAVPPDLLTDDLTTILEDDRVEVVVQLIGGVEPARTIMLSLLDAGKSVVTANKALLAHHGAELFDKARATGQSIAFEAAVGGGIPIIGPMLESLAANQVKTIQAILNGTSNFILSAMAEKGMAYDDAVAEAQRLGYAEADPTMDVDGTDAAQKLAILSHIAYGARADWSDITRTGIDTVDLADIRYASELGYAVKLLAVADHVADGLEMHVSPTLVRQGTPMSEVHDAFNAIRVVGDAVGPVFFHGYGAGQMPTASAVVGDVIDTLTGRAKRTFDVCKLWSAERPAPVNLRDPAKIPGRFYLRLLVDDRPGMLAKLTGVLGERGISISSVIQHESLGDDANAHAGAMRQAVPLVVMTHTATEGDIDAAIADMGELDGVDAPVVRLRVQE